MPVKGLGFNKELMMRGGVARDNPWLKTCGDEVERENI
jgi:hypothetical protein